LKERWILLHNLYNKYLTIMAKYIYSSNMHTSHKRISK